MFSSVAEHFLSRVEASPKGTEPFAHCVVDDILPPDVYREALERWPTPELFRTLAEEGRGHGYAERGVVPLTEQGLSRLDPETREFWSGLWSAISSSQILRGMVNKYQYEIRERIGEKVNFGVRPDGLLMRDRSNYAIGPHTDIPARLITILIYFPKDDRYRKHGTSFYVPRDPNFKDDKGQHWRFEDFIRTSTVDFVPNRLVSFVRTDSSFHGVEPVIEADVERHLICYNVKWRREMPARA